MDCNTLQHHLRFYNGLQPGVGYSEQHGWNTLGVVMAENEMAGLQASRDRLIRERKGLALRIGNDKLKVSDLATALIQVQQALDVVEAAISAEDAAQSSVYERRDLASG